MATARNIAVVLLPTLFAILATRYDGTAVRIILWTLAGSSAIVLLIDTANAKMAQARWPWLSRLPLVRAAGSFDPNELAERLISELGHGEEIKEYFLAEAYPPSATAEMVWGPIGDALDWARRVEQELREHAPEWLSEFATAGYEIPPEIEPHSVRVADMEAMLAARVLVLGRIIRALKSDGRVPGGG